MCRPWRSLFMPPTISVKIFTGQIADSIFLTTLKFLVYQKTKIFPSLTFWYLGKLDNSEIATSPWLSSFNLKNFWNSWMYRLEKAKQVHWKPIRLQANPSLIAFDKLFLMKYSTYFLTLFILYCVYWRFSGKFAKCLETFSRNCGLWPVSDGLTILQDANFVSKPDVVCCPDRTESQNRRNSLLSIISINSETNGENINVIASMIFHETGTNFFSRIVLYVQQCSLSLNFCSVNLYCFGAETIFKV